MSTATILDTTFDRDAMYVEYTVNDFFKNQLYFDVLSLGQFSTLDMQSIMVDVKRNLVESNFYVQNSIENSGNYLVRYTAFKTIVSTPYKKSLEVIQVSPTRKEVKLHLTDDYLTQTASFDALSQNIQDFSAVYSGSSVYPLDFYLNGQNGDKFQIVNSVQDPRDATGRMLIVKLSQPAPDSVQIGFSTWISRKISVAKEEGVVLTPSTNQQYKNQLQPDFTVVTSKHASQASGKHSYSTLLPSQATQSFDLGSMLLSSSNMIGSTLNVDFTDYSNFVTFGSAQSRLDAFFSRLKTIENCSSSIATLSASLADVERSGSTSIAIRNHIAYLNTQINTIVSQFDLYERFLFNETSSYATASGGNYDGLVVDFCYPKSSSTYPYAVQKTTSPSALAWYVTQSSLMYFYDNNNPNNLTRTIPEYIIQNEANKDYVTFVKMVGHYYDNIFIYLKNFLTIYDRSNDVYQGYPKEITYWIGQSIGQDLYNDNINADLLNYALGQDTTGKFINKAGSPYPLTAEEMTTEIWKRLIVSYPYIQKTKGTAQALKAIMACYGIPATILRIKEFGGPSQLSGSNSQEYVYEDFSYVLNFSGSSGAKPTLYVTWSNDSRTLRHPDTIQFRFSCPSNLVSVGSSDTIVSGITGSSNGAAWSIGITSISANSGYVYFNISSSATVLSSSNLNIYDGSYYTVQLSRTSGSDSTNISQSFVLSLAQMDSNTHLVQSVTSMSTALSSVLTAYTIPSKVAIGNVDGTQFVGTVDEFRLWNVPVSQDKFSYYIKQPSALIGNSISSSLVDLSFRLSFDAPQNIGLSSVATSASLLNEAYNTVYSVSASSSGWTSITTVPYQYVGIVRDNITYVPSNGYSKFESDKVRIENNWLASNTLHQNISDEVGEYDSNSVESNRLGIYFSPSDIVNEEIVRNVGPLQFDDLIGDPDDWTKSEYSSLETTRNFVYSYIPLYSFYEFLWYISLYNKTVFDTFKKYIPAYVNATVGVLIEPDVLDRDKVQIFRSSSIEDLQKIATFDVATYFSASGEDNTLSTEYNATENATLESEDLTHTGSYDVGQELDFSGYYENNYTASMEIESLATPTVHQYAAKVIGAIQYLNPSDLILTGFSASFVEPVYTTHTLYQVEVAQLIPFDYWSMITNGTVNAITASKFLLAANSPTLFVLTPANGIYVSSSGVYDWTNGFPITQPPTLNINDMKEYANTPYTIFVALTGYGVYHSTQDAGSWVQFHTSSLPSLNCHCVVVTGSKVFVGTDAGLCSSSIYNSAGTGSWYDWSSTALGTETVKALISTGFPNVGSCMFASAESGVTHSYVSNDGGTTWTIADTGLYGDGYSVRNFAVSGNTVLAAKGLGGIFYSNNSGSNWYQVNTGLPGGTYVYDLMVSSSDIYAMTSNGVYVNTGSYSTSSNDDRITWSVRNRGLTNTNTLAMLSWGPNTLVGTSGNGIATSNAVFLRNAAAFTNVNVARLSTNDMNLGIPGFPPYDTRHHRYFRDFRTASQNMKYVGCKITGLKINMIATTYDNMFNIINPVQIFNVNRNTVVVDSNNNTFTQ